MQIHQLKRTNKLKKGRYVGRGGKRGKTSGRGTKGQMARSGHKLRPELRDMIKKLPKLRGYRFKSFAADVVPVNLGDIEKNFDDGDRVTPVELIACGLVNLKSGKTPLVKILATGNLTKKITLAGVTISIAAKSKVEKVGGNIE